MTARTTCKSRRDGRRDPRLLREGCRARAAGRGLLANRVRADQGVACPPPAAAACPPPRRRRRAGHVRRVARRPRLRRRARRPFATPREPGGEARGGPFLRGG